MLIEIPGSKSLTIRALLLAALADGDSQLNNILLSEDTEVFISGLKELGVKIKVDRANKIAYVSGCDGQFPQNNTDIDCGNSGLTARFLLAACTLSSGTYRFDGIERMRQRPMQSLIEVLIAQGNQFKPENKTSFPLEMKVDQVFLGGDIVVSSEQSSQFASALLMMAPLAKNPVTLTIKNVNSRPYIEMTLEVMRQFGVEVERQSDDVFFVRNQQHYQACDYTIEPDLSTASYFFAAAALTRQPITIKGINRQNCLQGDIAFLSALEQMGCQVEQTSAGLTVVGPQQLTGIDIDMNAFSDTFMTLAAIAPFASSPSTISNIAHTRLKESDRIHAMATAFKRINVQIDEGDDWLRVYPSRAKAAVIDSYNDHRIAMSFAVLSLNVPGVSINNKHCVKKTFPGFFELMEAVFS